MMMDVKFSFLGGFLMQLLQVLVRLRSFMRQGRLRRFWLLGTNSNDTSAKRRDGKAGDKF